MSTYYIHDVREDLQVNMILKLKMHLALVISCIYQDICYHNKESYTLKDYKISVVHGTKHLLTPESH